MANEALSALTATTTLSDADLFYVVDGANSRKITWANFKTNLNFTSGLLKHESGGLEADVSAYDGLVKITGGATSAVTVTAAGEALLDDADIAAQRATLDVYSTGEVDTEISNLIAAAPGALDTLNELAAALGDDANFAATMTTALAGKEPADADILKADTPDVLTAGFATTPYNAGTKSTGTYTPDEANGNIQYAVNGGAHTLAPPTNNCTVIVHYTNNGSAGAITTSGFTLVDGDSFTTTDTHEFLCYITKANDVSHLTVKALQ